MKKKEKENEEKKGEWEYLSSREPQEVPFHGVPYVRWATPLLLAWEVFAYSSRVTSAEIELILRHCIEF